MEKRWEFSEVREAGWDKVSATKMRNGSIGSSPKEGFREKHQKK